MSPTPLHHTKTLVEKLWFYSTNTQEEALISTAKVRQLGMIYGIYRFIIAMFLLMTNVVLSRNKFGIPIPPSQIEKTSFTLYIAISLALIVILFFIRIRVRTQLMVGFILDVVFLTLFTLYSKVNDFQIILLYMVVIATSYMLLPLARATIVTLLSITAVIYQQFFRFFSSSAIIDKSLLSINDSLLFSVSLLAVGFLSRAISQRLANAEQSILLHAVEIEKLHDINHAVVKNMVNGVLVIDSQRNIVMINATAQQLLGLPIDSGACDSPAKIIELSRTLIKEHPDINNWYRSLNSNQSAELIYDLPTKFHHTDNNQEHTPDKLRISSKPLLENGQVLIIEDLHREQSQAQQLKLASLGQLSASIAHEIRNPLASISAASQVLMENMRHDDENAEFYEIIYQQTKRVNTIISDVISLSRQELPDQYLLNAPKWIAQFLNTHYADKFVVMTGEIDIPIPFYFDAGHLEQIMSNLINNALRHTVPQPLHNDVQIRLTKTPTGAFIDVLDYGRGVQDKDLPSLFHPFFTTNKTGIGLGLYLSQSFSEANNAKIRYFREGKMTCFRLIVSNTPVSG